MSKTIISGKTPSPKPMTVGEIERAARADPDAQPLTKSDLKRMKRTPRAKIIRRALELTQEEFAARYHIPIGTLRDWEQGRAEPDHPTQAYLTLIARDPEHVRRTLSMKGLSTAVTPTQAEAIEPLQKRRGATRGSRADEGVRPT